MRLFLLLTSSALVLTSSGQPTFRRTLQFPFPVKVLGCDTTVDHGLVLCGSADTGGGTRGMVVRLDALGSVAWTQTHEPYDAYGFLVDQSTYHGVSALPDSTFIVVGSAGPQLASNHRAVVKLSAAGDTIVGSYEVFGTWSNNYTEPLHLANGTDVVMWQRNSVGGGHGGLTALNPLTMELDYGIESGTESRFLCAAASPAGGLAAVAAFYGFGSDSTFHLVKVNDAMALEWQLDLDADQFNELVGLVTVAPDSAVYHVGGSGPLVVNRVSAAGALQWSRSLAIPGTVTPMGLATDGSDLIIAGHTLMSTTYVPWLCKIDAQGNLLWTYQYGAFGEQHHVRRLEAAGPGDGFYLVTQSGPGSDSSCMLMRIAADGTMSDCPFGALAASAAPITLGAGTDLSFIPASYSNAGAFHPVPQTQYANNGYTCGTTAAGTYLGSGNVFNDADSDAFFDSGEAPFAWLPLTVAPYIGTGFSFIDGSYTFLTTEQGPHTITGPVLPPWWQLTTGSASYQRTFSATDTVYGNLDFGFAAAWDTTVITGNYSSMAPRCAGRFWGGLTLTNTGTTTPAGHVAVSFDPGLSIWSSSIPADSIVGSTAYWSYASIPFFQQWDLLLTFYSNGALQAGDTATTTIVVHAHDGFGNVIPVDTLIWQDTVVCGFDPNDKVVSPTGSGTVGGIPADTDWLTYTIRFQNTGTDTAFTVVIEDQLSEHLQWNTLQFLGASHDLSGLAINPYGRATFTFNNILLPDSNVNEPASHGFVAYRIAPDPGLPHLTAITNNSGIFFDGNPPVMTNTVLNTVVDCGQVGWSAGAIFSGGYLFGVTYGPTSQQLTFQWYFNGAELPQEQSSFVLPMVSGDYHVVITDAYGCSQTSPVATVIIMSTSDNGTPGFRVFPNPFTDATTLMMTEAIDANTIIELVDVHGRLVRSLQGNGTRQVTIERSDLPSGMYTVLVWLGDGRVLRARLVSQ